MDLKKKEIKKERKKERKGGRKERRKERKKTKILFLNLSPVHIIFIQGTNLPE